MGKNSRRAAAAAAEVEQKIRAIWDRLPKIECQGMCWDSCGPIEMTKPERRMIERRGVDIPVYDYTDGPSLCTALTDLKRCSVYEDRPTICRLWGLTEGVMRCNYGCVPEGGHLTRQEAYLLIADVLEAAGDQRSADQLRYLWTGDNAPRSELLLIQKERSDLITRSARVARAEANGTALYATGRGGLSKTPPGGKPK